MGKHQQAKETASTNKFPAVESLLKEKFKANKIGGQLAMLRMLVEEVGEVARSQTV